MAAAAADVAEEAAITAAAMMANTMGVVRNQSGYIFVACTRAIFGANSLQWLRSS